MDKRNLRYNILTVLVYIIGIILIIQLFNLQIVHGEEYREKSSTRLTRETKIEAARGNILDRNGNTIAGTITQYSLEIYKSKIDKQTLNNTLLEVTKVLDQHNDSYKDKFPIDAETLAFTMDSQEEINNWLKSNKLEENLTSEQVINKFKEKYEIKNEDIKEARKIIGLRYGIEKEGYSSMSAYVISNNISKESVAIFEEQSSKFPGIATSTTPRRKYLRGNLASHILGYIGPINKEELDEHEGYSINDYIGKTGIEFLFEKYLKGENGKKQTDMTIDGVTSAEYITKEAVAGDDVVLTIDANLQSVAESALKNNIEKIRTGGFAEQRNVNNGAVVALDVKTGEVLAMASYPDFEPELFIDGISNQKWTEYTQEGKSALINRTMSAYAPGSIFKMASAIAGLETGAVTRTETINDTGIYPKGYKPRCWYYTSYGRGHGPLNVSGAIKNSCNYYFYELITRMGIDNLEKYAKYFGLGEKTNVELPGETSGTLAGKTLYEKLGQTWYYGNSLSAVIGQAENNFTPLQIAKYIAMLTNGGKRIDVTLIKDIINAEGQSLPRDEINSYVAEKLGIKKTEQEDLNINQDNLNAVLEGMKSVTTETGGTAYSVFKNFPIEVGGKTGSAEAGDNVNAWFVGFAPYEAPEIAVVVLVENGSHGYYAAEVAKEIIEAQFKLKENVSENNTALPYTEQQN